MFMKISTKANRYLTSAISQKIQITLEQETIMIIKKKEKTIIKMLQMLN